MTPTDANARPNIVLLIAHDLGCHIGPYGWAKNETRRLTRLAEEGICFERHFVTSPGCSQSRSSLVTGRYPHMNGQLGLAHLGWELNRDEMLLPAALRSAGYRTALFGIWHLHDWTLSAFDEVSADVSTRDESPEDYAEVAGPRAAAWLRKNARQTRPFCLHVGFWETHRPFCGAGKPAGADHVEVPTDSIGEVPDWLPDNEACRRELAELHQSVSRVDRAVGEVLEALDETGLADETLVLFTVDHGLPFPRAKGTLYDPGVHVALLARWPGRIPAGRCEDRLTSNVDVMPTLLDAAGAPVPEPVVGHSFLGLMTGSAEVASRREPVFAEKTYHEHYDPMRSVRTERFKYIRNFADRPRLVMPSDVYNSPTRQSLTDDEALWGPRPREELYDLTADPLETANVADDPTHAATLADLRDRLDAWMRETNDPLLHGPVPRPTRQSPPAPVAARS